jgi:hypothetical protein
MSTHRLQGVALRLRLLIILVAVSATVAYSQKYKDWEDEDVEEFYEKVSVKNGTLDERGNRITFVLVPTSIKAGVYEVEIADLSNDIYEIKGTNYFLKFRGYYGYAGYGDEGVLVVGGSAWSSTFYKKP